MRGRLIDAVWKHDPAVYAPPRYRRACRYQAFVPFPLGAGLAPLAPEVAGVVSEAERILSGAGR